METENTQITVADLTEAERDRFADEMCFMFCSQPCDMCNDYLNRTLADGTFQRDPVDEPVEDSEPENAVEPERTITLNVRDAMVLSAAAKSYYYALKDEYDDAVRYTQITSDAGDRMAQHLMMQALEQAMQSVLKQAQS